MKLQLKDAQGFARDPESKAILNLNKGALEETIRKREQSRRLVAIENRLDKLEQSLETIISLLKHG